jgi:hypothetical protein
MALVRIIRNSYYPERFRAYRLILDRKTIDTIRAGETKELSVSPGQHELSARIDWCGSNTVRFTLFSDSDTVIFHISPSVRGMRLFLFFELWRVIFSAPDSYLKLE